MYNVEIYIYSSFV